MKNNTFCQYSDGYCNQGFENIKPLKGFFVYPSEPRQLALTILQTVKELQTHSSSYSWRSWEELNTPGQIIFCEICKAIKSSELVVANITTLNFNVLFELGFTIGLNKPYLL